MMAYKQLLAKKTIGWLLDSYLQDSRKLPSEIQTTAVGNLVLDSRYLTVGDLFIALPGEQSNGANYVDDAIAKGAVGALLPSDSSELCYEWRQGQKQTRVPLIYIPELTRYLTAIAAQFYGKPSTKVPVVGITGTNGKTTCAHLLAQLSAFSGRSCGVSGTVGCSIYAADNEQPSHPNKLVLANSVVPLTTPDALTIQANMSEMLIAGAELLVLEASSHGLVQGRVAAVDINTAIFTNLTHDHLDYHGDMHSYGQAKAKLFTMPSVSKAVINIDDAFGRQLIDQLPSALSIVTYSIDNPTAHFYLTGIDYKDKGILANLHSPFGVVGFYAPLLGQFNLSNLLASFATCITNTSELHQMAAYTEKLTPVIGRMESIANDAELNVIVDFAHTPDALKNALAAAAIHCSGQLWCVFGCGGNRDSAKRPLMAAAAEQFASHIIVTSDNPRGESPTAIIEDICSGFSDDADYTVIVDRHVAINIAIEQMQPQDLVLIAGKGHEDYQHIANEKLPFSDQLQARMALQLREQPCTKAKRNHRGNND